MHSKSDNIKVMTYDKADKVIQELFESLIFRYQTDFRKGIYERRSFIFDCVSLSRYKRQKINPKRSESNIDSPHWIKTKKQQQILSIRITNAFNTLLH